jgi:tetratricopeptide (TPR) repeat protein
MAIAALLDDGPVALDDFVALDARGSLRATIDASAAHLERGELDAAITKLEGARALPGDDVDRAELLYHLGDAQLASGAVADACALLTLALDVCNRSTQPTDHLRARIFERRARCHRHHREWPAARADVERGLKLAEVLGDDALIAQASLQASIVAEREGQWIVAQFYAERAREIFIGLGDVFGVGRCLNNLGGLSFLLSKPEDARRQLTESFSILLDLGRDVEAAYAVSSLAQVQLRTGEFEDAERLSRRALVFIGSRVDHRTELGNAQIVLGRALLGLERLDEAAGVFLEAERTLARAPIGERAAVWLAQGDVAAKRGDADLASQLYRSAAEALQDFHF